MSNMTMLWAAFGYTSNLYVMLFMKFRNLICDRMMDIILACWMKNANKNNIWADWIMNKIVIKFSGLKIKNGGNTMMHCDATYYQTTHCRLNKFSWWWMIKPRLAKTVPDRYVSSGDSSLSETS